MGERDPMRVPYKFGEVCEHGRLKRQCDECQLDWENRTLRTQLADAKADNARLREALAQARDRLSTIDLLTGGDGTPPAVEEINQALTPEATQ